MNKGIRYTQTVQRQLVEIIKVFALCRCLVGLGACTSMDVISVLNKQKQPIESYHVDVQGVRTSPGIPSVFEHIHVLFKVKGGADAKLHRAIYLSMTKYCSVTRMLESKAKITSATYSTMEYEIPCCGCRPRIRKIYLRLS